MSTINKRPLIILTGPTAVGKTSLSIALAKAINGEIISADSMQVYRRCNIGTAKITRQEMDGVPHYLIDVLDPKEDFNVVIFQKMAKQAIEFIYERGHIPLIVGGTGFYIQALLYDIAFENTDTSDRSEYIKFYEKYGAHALHEQLKEIDLVSYNEIHENNVKRVIRALEFYKETGYPISEHNKNQREKQSPYLFEYIVLHDDRAKLYERIEKRIDEMVEQGLVEEVRSLLEYGCEKEMVSMQGLGYKELIPYIRQEKTLEECIGLLKKNTRHFAKRQLTWFRREQEVTWLDKQEYPKQEQQLSFILDRLYKKQILEGEQITC